MSLHHELAAGTGANALLSPSHLSSLGLEVMYPFGGQLVPLLELRLTRLMRLTNALARIESVRVEVDALDVRPLLRR